MESHRFFPERGGFLHHVSGATPEGLPTSPGRSRSGKWRRSTWAMILWSVPFLAVLAFPYVFEGILRVFHYSLIQCDPIEGPCDTASGLAFIALYYGLIFRHFALGVWILGIAFLLTLRLVSDRRTLRDDGRPGISIKEKQEKQQLLQRPPDDPA